MKKLIIVLAALAIMASCELQLNKGFPAWDAGTSYGYGAIVQENGQDFISTANQNKGNDPATAFSWWNGYKSRF